MVAKVEDKLIKKVTSDLDQLHQSYYPVGINSAFVENFQQFRQKESHCKMEDIATLEG